MLGGDGVVADTAHSARTATVAAGDSCVTLLTPSKTSIFTVGNYVAMTGFDLQGYWNGGGYGFPPNNHFFDYVKVANIDPGTGRICFETSLKNAYKSTWPLFDRGGGQGGGVLGADQGGPATLRFLDPSWGNQIEFRGLTIDQPNAQ